MFLLLFESRIRFLLFARILNTNEPYFNQYQSGHSRNCNRSKKKLIANPDGKFNMKTANFIEQRFRVELFSPHFIAQ